MRQVDVEHLPYPGFEPLFQRAHLLGKLLAREPEFVDEVGDDEKHGGDRRAADERHHEQGAGAARHLERFQPIDERVERVGQKEGEKERDEDAAQQVDEAPAR